MPATPEVPGVDYLPIDSQYVPVDIQGIRIRIPRSIAVVDSTAMDIDVANDEFVDPGLIQLQDEEDKAQRNGGRAKRTSADLMDDDDDGDYDDNIDFFSDNLRVKRNKEVKSDEEKVDFSMLPPPEHASHLATKALCKELMSLKKVQDSVSQAGRGWYLDFSKITNLYQ